jgi:hypothetical protein
VPTVIEINDQVRGGRADLRSPTTADRDLRQTASRSRPPYVIEAIGDPSTMSYRGSIPGGLTATSRGAQAAPVEVEELDVR